MKYIMLNELIKTYENYDKERYDYILLNNVSNKMKEHLKEVYRILDSKDHNKVYYNKPYRLDQLVMYISKELVLFEYPVKDYLKQDVFNIIVMD